MVTVTIKSPISSKLPVRSLVQLPRAAERDMISKYKSFAGTKPATTFVPCLAWKPTGDWVPQPSKHLADLWDHAHVGAEARPKLDNYRLATLSVGLSKGHVRGLERMSPPGVSAKPEQR